MLYVLPVLENHGLHAIATENKDFDGIGIKRIWIHGIE